MKKHLTSRLDFQEGGGGEGWEQRLVIEPKKDPVTGAAGFATSFTWRNEPLEREARGSLERGLISSALFIFVHGRLKMRQQEHLNSKLSFGAGVALCVSW